MTSMAGPVASTTEVEDIIDGGPLGALLVGPVASTTEVEEDLDGGPLGALPVGSAAHTLRVQYQAKQAGTSRKFYP
jgi:hypothetical protein